MKLNDEFMQNAIVRINELIILGAQKDVRLAQEVISKQREAIQSLEYMLDQMKIKADDDKNKLKNLEQSIAYLKKALEQNIQYVNAA